MVTAPRSRLQHGHVDACDPTTPIRSPGGPRKAPSLDELEVLAGEVFARLPEKFRELCEGLVIRVDDFPTDEVLDDMDIESEFDLLGLFQGVGLPFRSESAPVQMPNMIWLYRRPILDYWAEHDETLGAIVAHVLVHEIGHHFGLSDDDMEAIERGGGMSAASSSPQRRALHRVPQCRGGLDRPPRRGMTLPATGSERPDRWTSSPCSRAWRRRSR